MTEDSEPAAAPVTNRPPPARVPTSLRAAALGISTQLPPPERPHRRHRRRLPAGTRTVVLSLGSVLVLVGALAALMNPSLSFLGYSRGQRPVLSTEAAGAAVVSYDETPTIPLPSTTATPTTPTTPAPAATEPPTTEAPTAGAQNWTPTAVRVPKIGIDAPVDSMGVDENNSLEVPPDTSRIGWWSGGTQPGDVGPAVLVGHIDSRKGPGVFFKLSQLEPGDEFEVDRADGTTVRFRVTRLESHPKTAFPTDEVYGDTDKPEARLITCFGSFDPAKRSYRNNLIAYAEQVG